MNPSIHSAAEAPRLRPVSGALTEAIDKMRKIVQALDRWLEARERATADRLALANMSDRELLDIGIDRASVSAVADHGWIRDRT